MSSRADGTGSADEPDIEQTGATGSPGDIADTADTVQRPAPAPDFIDRAPFGPSAVPDQAPIQRFDERPRFDPPPATAPAASAMHRPSAPPPGIDATTGPRRRRLLIPALAFGCAMLLLLGIGGGLTALWLTGPREQPPSATSSDPSDADPGSGSDSGSGSVSGTTPGVWEPLGDGQVPSGGADELQQVLAENPLMQARLPVPDQCTMPPTEGGAVAEDELQTSLEAGADCLATAWSEALEGQGLDFVPPSVAVYSDGTPPAGAACAARSFTATAPVVCQADRTLYWPADWDPGFSHTSAEETPQLYMWHLSYSYTMFALASASLDDYYGALLLALADDAERAEESQRRWALQVSCLSSAAAFRMPEGIRPAGRVGSFVSSVEAQASPSQAGDPAPSSRARWVGAGRDGDGTLGQCTVWSAPSDAVA